MDHYLVYGEQNISTLPRLFSARDCSPFFIEVKSSYHSTVSFIIVPLQCIPQGVVHTTSYSTHLKQSILGGVAYTTRYGTHPKQSVPRGVIHTTISGLDHCQLYTTYFLNIYTFQRYTRGVRYIKRLFTVSVLSSDYQLLLLAIIRLFAVLVAIKALSPTLYYVLRHPRLFILYLYLLMPPQRFLLNQTRPVYAEIQELYE